MKRLLAVFIIPIFLVANPTGHQVVNGQVDLNLDDTNKMTMNCSDRAIVHWDQFSIDESEQAFFVLPDEQSSMLNRVVGENISQIDGQLHCNGKMYLINPKGIVFGENSIVDTGALIAATLHCNDEDFLQKGSFEFSGSEDAMIVHRGTINGSKEIVFVSRQIDSEGSITTDGKITFASGEHVVFQADGNIFIHASGDKLEDKLATGIRSKGNLQGSDVEFVSDGNLYELAIQQDGIIEAEGFKEIDGKVVLIAKKGRIEVQGDLFAASKEKDTGGLIEIDGREVGILGASTISTSAKNKGGVINIYSDQEGFSYLSPEATLAADALQVGDGGEVNFISDNTAFFFGSISGKGGTLGGNGGFIDVSGRRNIEFWGQVTTFSPNGKTGTLLIDPTDITISTGTTTPPSFAFPPAQSLFTRPGPTAILNNSELVSQLDNNNVTVNTSPGVGGANGGRIVVDDPVSWTGAFDLTLTADESIIVNASINAGEGGNLNFEAGSNVTFRGLSPGLEVVTRLGDINIDAGGSVLLTSIDGSVSVISLGGNIDVNASSNMVLTGSSTTADGAAILESSLFLGSFGDITVDANNVNLNAGNALNTSAQILTDSGGGNIFITTLGALNLNGGTGSQSPAVIASGLDVNIDTGSALNLTSGNATGSQARIFSESGTGTIDVGTGAAANLTLSGDATGGNALISVDGSLIITNSQTMNIANAEIQSRSDDLTLIGTNQINLDDSEIFAQGILTVQDATLFDLDSATATGLASVQINIPTVDLSASSLIQGDEVTIVGNNLTLNASEINAVGGDLIIENSNMLVNNASNVFASDNLTLNGRNLTLNNDSTIITEGSITIVQTGVLNDVQVLGTTLSSAIRCNDLLDISTETLTINNGELESFNEGILISATDFSATNNALVRADFDSTYTIGNNFTMNNASVISTSSFITIEATGDIDLQAGSLIEASSTVTTNANALTVDNSNILSLAEQGLFVVSGDFSLSNGAIYYAFKNIDGTALSLTLDESTFESQDRFIFLDIANSVVIQNSSTISARRDITLASGTSLVLDSGLLECRKLFVTTPLIDLSNNSLMDLENLEFNTSIISLADSEILLTGSFIVQP